MEQELEEWVSLYAASQELGVTRQRMSKIAQTRKWVTSVHQGVKHVRRSDVDQLKTERRSAGRPSAPTALAPGVASPAMTAVVIEALADLVFQRVDLFRKAPGGQVPLDSTKLALTPQARSLLRGAMGDHLTLDRALEVLAHLQGLSHILEIAPDPLGPDPEAIVALARVLLVPELHARVWRGSSPAAVAEALRLITGPGLWERLEAPPSGTEAVVLFRRLISSGIPASADPTTTSSQLARALLTFAPPALDARIRSPRMVRVLFHDQHLVMNQVMLAIGPPGSLKSHLAATLALTCAFETGRPVLYYVIEQETPAARLLLDDTARTLRRANPRYQEKRVEIVSAEQSAPSLTPQPQQTEATVTGSPGWPPDGGAVAPVLLHGLPGTWDELRAETKAALSAHPNASAIIVDSIGSLSGNLERAELAEFLDTLHGPLRFVVLVAELNSDTEAIQVLERLRWVADLVLELGYNLPDGAQTGPATRTLEIHKSRYAPAHIGRHALELPPDRPLTVYPAVEVWRSAKITPDPKLAGVSDARRFSLEGTAWLAALDELAGGWSSGCSLALRGPAGTFKEHLTLYAAANALQNGHSAIFINLRRNFEESLKATLKRYTDLNAVLEHRVETFDPDRIGQEPKLHVLPLSVEEYSAERLLWELSRAITRKGPHPVSVCLLAHFSELVVSPGFASTHAFTMMLLTLLANAKVSALAQIDVDSWVRNLDRSHYEILLPVWDVAFQLARESEAPQAIEVCSSWGIAYVVREEDGKGGFRLRAGKGPFPRAPSRRSERHWSA